MKAEIPDKFPDRAGGVRLIVLRNQTSSHLVHNHIHAVGKIDVDAQLVSRSLLENHLGDGRRRLDAMAGSSSLAIAVVAACRTA